MVWLSFNVHHYNIGKLRCYIILGLFENTLPLVKIMAWRRTGDMPLTKQMMHHQTLMGWCMKLDGDSPISFLTHWGRVTHMRRKLTIIGSNNGLSPGRRQAVIWTGAGILLIWHVGTNFSEILIEIQIFFLLTKMRFKCRLRNVVHFVSASMC